MTGDARGEAERIVEAVNVTRASEDALVAALAAAIEETDAEDDVLRRGFVAKQRVESAREARRDALSALRARAGEET